MLAAERILRALAEHEVEYVLIGAFAATVHGSALRTDDLDICPSRDPLNLRKLSAALDVLEAKEYDPHKGELVEREWAAAALEDVIRSKEATDRPRDREQLPTLRRLLDLSRGE